MTERWQTQLEHIERLNPDDDLLERAARQLQPTSIPRDGAAKRAGAIAVAALLTVVLVAGIVVVLRDRSPATNIVLTPPEVIENGDFLFTKHTDKGWHIFSLDPETGEEIELTYGVRDYGSDWSPDGTKIVYDSETPKGYEILIAGADGSNPVLIAEGESPSWSPDGTRIAYVGEGGAIWVVNPDGSDAHPVTAGAAASEETVSYPSGLDWNPSWSPDSRSIAYTRLVSERLAPLPKGEGRTSVTLEELRVWSEDGTDIALTDAYAALGEIDWSPDGSTLVFTGSPTLFHDQSTNGLVWPRVLTIPASGGGVAAVTPERDRWIGGATWSPDGEWIAFQDDYETIAMIRTDGSGRTEIDIGYEVIGLSWGVAPQRNRTRSSMRLATP
jgi:Tol biopolymer transport system component